MMQKDAVIFDMDGVLIDSEPYWRQAQVDVLAGYGMTATFDDCIRLTMGRRLDDIAKIWCQHFNLNIPSEELQLSIMQAVVALIRQQGEPKRGVVSLLQTLQGAGVKIALATSSSMPIIDAVLNSLKISQYFSVVCSADNEEYGKPHPSVYLTAAQKLDVAANQCVVIEDSVTGMIAGLAAGMTTFAVPDNIDDPRFAVASGRFSSLEELEHHLIKTGEVKGVMVR
ncbi:hexitol phosphatase HxpB [Photobacterium rosenbergii]|uniref:hexitol phosphatase HxpB n=1 Tax=Photobacterium rosenbergii TaxID=294936 RepID=UPI001C9A0158|nr:hexitol phosphatase HxpB [Photobacterium rosenbergii]MBY5946695.1 hexitol phosphatase HxpB [Photobacterium rosenbergii]